MSFQARVYKEDDNGTIWLHSIFHDIGQLQEIRLELKEIRTNINIIHLRMVSEDRQLFITTERETNQSIKPITDNLASTGDQC